jgi:hypothetical protein
VKLAMRVLAIMGIALALAASGAALVMAHNELAASRSATADSAASARAAAASAKAAATNVSSMKDTLAAGEEASTAQADCVSTTLGLLTNLSAAGRADQLTSMAKTYGENRALYGPYFLFVLNESNVGTINQDTVTTVCASPKYYRAAQAFNPAVGG